MQILVTGAAGFIGFHLCRRLLKSGIQVVGLDALSTRDPLLQLIQNRRLDQLKSWQGFQFEWSDIRDVQALQSIFCKTKFSQVIHLAARTGVRESFQCPQEYHSVNVDGTSHLVRIARESGVGHFLFTSSSSVYGEGEGPCSEQSPLNPISPYGLSKLLMEKAVFATERPGFCITGIRPFSVYGPWGRPDMAYFKYANQIMNDLPIELFHRGAHRRDFTFIDDIVEGLFRVIQAFSKGEIRYSSRIFNLGRGQPEPVTAVVKCLEKNLERTAKVKVLEKQRGDAEVTWSDSAAFQSEFQFTPQTSLQEGMERFSNWWVDTFSKNMPLITLQMVVRNGEKFIAQAIESALKQTVSDFELVIVDDGSTDATQSEVFKFADPRIRVFVNPCPGLSRARQLALRESRGKWTAIFDADDIACPNRLERALAAVQPGVVLVGGQIEEVSEEAEPISSKVIYPTEEIQIRRRIGRGYSICHGTSLFDTAVARAVGGYQDENKSFGEDEDLFVRLASRGSVRNLAQVLIQRRIHRYSVCTRFQNSQWVLAEKFFSKEQLEEAAYWARLGKAALRGQNSKLAKSYFGKSLKWCPLKINAWWGRLQACV